MASYVFSKLGDYAKRVVDYVKDEFTTVGYSAEVILSATVDIENILITIDTARALTSQEQTTLGSIIQSYVARPEIIQVTVNSRNIIRVSQVTDVDIDFHTITDAVNYVNSEYNNLNRQVTIMVMAGSYVCNTLVVPDGTIIQGQGVAYVEVQNMTLGGEVELSGLDITGVGSGPTIVVGSSGVADIQHCKLSTTTSGVAIVQNTASTLKLNNCQVSGYQTGVSTSGLIYITDCTFDELSNSGISVNQYGQCYASTCQLSNCDGSGVFMNGGSGTLSTCYFIGCQNGIMVSAIGTPQLVLNGLTMSNNTLWDMNIEATIESNSVIISTGGLIDYNKIRNIHGIQLLWNSLALTANGFRHVFSGDVAVGFTGTSTRMIVGQGEVLKSLYSVFVQITSFQITSVVPYVALRVTFPPSAVGALTGGTWQYKTLTDSWVVISAMIITAGTLEALPDGFDMSISRDYYVLLGQIPLGIWNYHLTFTVPSNLSIPSETTVVPMGDATVTTPLGKVLRIGDSRVVSQKMLYEHSGNTWYIFKSPNAPLPWVNTLVVPNGVDLSWPVTINIRYTSLSSGNIQWRLRYLFSNNDNITQNGTVSYIQQPIDMSLSTTVLSTVSTLQTNKVIAEQFRISIPIVSIFATLEVVPVTPLTTDILLLNVSMDYMAYT